MYKFAKKVVQWRVAIFILALILLIPAAIGYINTRINYDILYYLPDDIETMEGQDILVDQFGTGAFSMMVTEGLSETEVSNLRKQIEEVDNVARVVSYDSLVDISIPSSALPDKIVEMFQTDDGDTNLMFVIFETSTSSEETMQAIEDIREIGGSGTFLSGMSTIVTDTRILADKETPVYVAIAVLCSLLILGITMDSFAIPIIFLLSIGMAIIYNLGSNILMGEISYVTKAIAAVLQLGVTMDYSIFLWHSYQEQTERFNGDKLEGMTNAIAATATSVFGSSFTTIAGFISMCFMSFTLGFDMGVVMAKGVLCGIIACVTILPSMILIFDKVIEKTRHKPFIRGLSRVSGFVTKHYIALIVIFLIMLPFAIYGNNNIPVYYNLDKTLPDTLSSVQSQNELQEKFDLNCSHMVLVSSDLPSYKVAQMCDEIGDVEGVDSVLGLDVLTGASIPSSFIPDDIKEVLESDEYKLILINSSYKIASDEMSTQITSLNSIIKSYDSGGMLVGEAPCTEDLITITAHDFAVVSTVSIGLVFLIILITFWSLTIPVMLVAVIEFAIFVNMSLAYYMNTTLPFIAQIIIGTIQLGSTVDYAILMTTKYKQYRTSDFTKEESLVMAHETSVESVIVSALSFFGATFGVALYSGIDMIASLCSLMARGAIVSMIVVMLVLPALLRLLDPLIIRTSGGFKEVVAKEREAKNRAHTADVHA